MEDFLLPDQGDNIIRTRNFENEFSTESLGVVLFEKMGRFKDQICQIDSITGISNTELLEQCTRTALEMLKRGIQEDDIVCICSYNAPKACIPYLAGLFIGAQVCALDPIMSFEDQKHLLKQVPPNIIFTSRACQKLLERVVEDLNLNSPEVIVFESLEFEKFLKPKFSEKEFKPRKVCDVFKTASIFFSSGTTGLPKGICINHYSLLHQAYILAYYICFTMLWLPQVDKRYHLNLPVIPIQGVLEIKRQRMINGKIMLGMNLKICLGFASLYWVSTVNILISSILFGQTRLLCPNFDSQQIWYLIDKYKVTMIMLASTQAFLLLKSNKPTNLNFETLKIVAVGAAPVSTELFLGLQNAFPNAKVIQGYGWTEVGGTVTFSKPNCAADIDLLKNKPRSCGRPVPGFWYKVVDVESEKTLKPNQKGELRLKTRYQMNGYYNMDSSNAWDSKGWIKTGDICYYDEDYCFYVVDRIKELIKYRGWHVSPALLEGILLKHPAVKMAIVIGVPHKEDNEHPLALVLLGNCFTDTINEKELQNFVDNQVDDNKKLRAGVKFIDTMPQTPSGKIKRNFLKKQILSQLA